MKTPISVLGLPYNPLKQTLSAQNTLSMAQLHSDYCLIETLENREVKGLKVRADIFNRFAGLRVPAGKVDKLSRLG